METKTPNKRTLQGVVVSDKMSKTVVVRVDRMKLHPKYKKQYKQSRRFKVHDEKNEYKVGDVVRFIETRPMSKDKRWRVVAKVVA
ncbi:30S ribosomal protein S17 [Candidatus Uhrbacteria bacterium]|nr:30S ribosomal protein S17 [Candidatus Uhrbacteria bacterium]